MAAREGPRSRPDVLVLFCIVLTLAALAFVGGRLIVVGSQQDAILGELQAIRMALEAPPAPQPPGGAAANQPPAGLTLSLDDAAVKGSADAMLTIVEFADFECPFCGQYVRDTHERIDREYVQTGKVRYAFRNFPLEQIHPHALEAGVAGECARQRGLFWDMHARMFADQQALTDAGLLKSATALGLSEGPFERCLTDAMTVARVRRDFQEGVSAGVRATPSFFIGTTAADGSVNVLRTLQGAQPFSVFQQALDELLASSAS